MDKEGRMYEWAEGSMGYQLELLRESVLQMFRAILDEMAPLLEPIMARLLKLADRLV